MHAHIPSMRGLTVTTGRQQERQQSEVMHQLLRKRIEFLTEELELTRSELNMKVRECGELMEVAEELDRELSRDKPSDDSDMAKAQTWLEKLQENLLLSTKNLEASKKAKGDSLSLSLARSLPSTHTPPSLSLRPALSPSLPPFLPRSLPPSIPLPRRACLPAYLPPFSNRPHFNHRRCICRPSACVRGSNHVEDRHGPRNARMVQPIFASVVSAGAFQRCADSEQACHSEKGCRNKT